MWCSGGTEKNTNRPTATESIIIRFILSTYRSNLVWFSEKNVSARRFDSSSFCLSICSFWSVEFSKPQKRLKKLSKTFFDLDSIMCSLDFSASISLSFDSISVEFMAIAASVSFMSMVKSSVSSGRLSLIFLVQKVVLISLKLMF